MLRTASAILICVTLASCDAERAGMPAAAAPPAVVGGDNSTAMRHELDALKSEVAELKEKQNQDDFDRMFKDFDRIAYLQPGDTGYSTLRYDLGALTVQLADVSPYANGSKVSLRFGNPLASTVNGLKTTIDWGHTDEKGAPDNASAKSKEFTFTDSLRSGSWTTVSLVLEGVPPAELGFVRVKNVSHTGIQLNR